MLNEYYAWLDLTSASAEHTDSRGSFLCWFPVSRDPGELTATRATRLQESNRENDCFSSLFYQCRSDRRGEKGAIYLPLFSPQYPPSVSVTTCSSHDCVGLQFPMVRCDCFVGGQCGKDQEDPSCMQHGLCKQSLKRVYKTETWILENLDPFFAEPEILEITGKEPPQGKNLETREPHLTYNF